MRYSAKGSFLYPVLSEADGRVPLLKQPLVKVFRFRKGARYKFGSMQAP